MLEDVGLSLNLLKIFVQHCATLLAQQCCMMLASFEQAFNRIFFIKCLVYSNRKSVLQKVSERKIEGHLQVKRGLDKTENQYQQRTK